jgi:hypothetical protein
MTNGWHYDSNKAQQITKDFRRKSVTKRFIQWRLVRWGLCWKVRRNQDGYRELASELESTPPKLMANPAA